MYVLPNGKIITNNSYLYAGINNLITQLATNEQITNLQSQISSIQSSTSGLIKYGSYNGNNTSSRNINASSGQLLILRQSNNVSAVNWNVGMLVVLFPNKSITWDNDYWTSTIRWSGSTLYITMTPDTSGDYFYVYNQSGFLYEYMIFS